MRIESTDGASSAPKRPCSPRAPISMSVVCDGAADGRRQGEPGHADHQRALRSEHVADAAPQEEEAAERQRVGGDHPLPIGVGEPESVLRRGQGDDHDRRVEHHHELRPGDDDEDPHVGPGRRLLRHSRVGVLQRGHRFAPADFAAAGSCLERIRSTWFWLSGRCANSASVGRMPAIKQVEMPLPRLGCVRARRLEHAPDRPQREGDVGAPQVEADPAVRLRVGEQSGDQLAGRLHQVVIGDPQLGQAAEMLRLERARLLEEVLEPGPVGPRRRVTGEGDGRLEDVGNQRLDEGLLGGEVAVQRAHADAGRRGHVGHAGLEPLLLEDLTGRNEQTLPVLQGVAAHRSDHGRRRPARSARSAGLVSGDFTPLTLVGEAERSIHFARASGRPWGTMGPCARPTEIGP